MMQNWQQLEADLCAAYRQQTAAYTHALGIAEQLLAAWKPGVDPNECLREIAALMDQIGGVNAALAGSRQEWVQSGKKPGSALAAALDELAQVIARLGDRIRELEALALGRKCHLVPEVDRILRGRQMQQAYGAGRSRIRSQEHRP